MNKEDAHKLLKDTFKNSFNEEQFVKFITEIFNGAFEYKKSKIFVHSSFKEYISEAYDLGKYKNNRQILNILIIKLKKHSSIDRARTMQRNFVANYLKYKQSNASLIAFTDENLDDWRFSFVKVEAKIVFNDSGKLKTSTEITPIKRYSYLVGKNESNYTCQKQLESFIIKNEINPTIDEIEKSFSVDNVTKEFFNEYKNLYFRLKESLDSLVEKDENIKKEFSDKDIDSISFSKKLLGQIVFLYFLQKKGWLGVTKDNNGDFNKWGSGPKGFLKRLFDKKLNITYNNFFNDILEPLFYEALAIDRKENNDYYSRFKCKIPFLNGGLFEPINNYSWEKTDILIDNAIFKDIFDVFDRFNFTIKEDEPLDKEVAVDPEMLGRVFEELLEVNDRKSKGAFYTPREIVHYMCQQSLINYLETNLKIENIIRNDIDYFVINGEYTLSELIRDQEDSKQNNYTISVNRFPLPDSIKINFKKIDELLLNVKIADPAVGSGAFPVGMMTEIIKCRSILTFLLSEKEQKKRTNYFLKRETIENSLYGVDIEPSAVEIAKLRFWLSLIVDEDNMDNIKPLPNLDNKIMCGNSLLDEFEEIKLFNNLLINKNKEKDSYQTKIFDSKSDILFKKLQKLQKEYFNESSRIKKHELKAQIDNIEWGFIEEKLKEQNSKEALDKLQKIKKSKSKPFFIWELYFNDVFNRDNPGFDIVIGNPPYINIEQINSDLKPVYSKFKTAFQKYDLYILFYELGIDLLREDGNISYITSNKFLSQKYGLKLRQLFLKNNINIIINFNYDIFDTATVRTSIIQISKKYFEKNLISIIDIHTKEQKFDFINKNYKYIQQNIFDKTEENNFRINLTQDKLILLRKIKNNCLQVQDICSVNYGLRPSSEKLNLKKEFFIYLKKEKPEFKKYFEGKDMGYWSLKNSYYLDFQPKVMYNPMFPELFNNDKLVGLRTLSDISKLRFIYDDNKHYCNDSVVILTLWYKFKNVDYVTIKRTINLDKMQTSKKYNLFYLQSILNSKIIKFYFNELYYDGTHFYPNHMKVLPIKHISPEQQKPFIQLVDQILLITKDEDYLENKIKLQKVKQLEAEIDQLVYKLYELTLDEIKIIEENK